MMADFWKTRNKFALIAGILIAVEAIITHKYLLLIFAAAFVFLDKRWVTYALYVISLSKLYSLLLPNYAVAVVINSLPWIALSVLFTLSIKAKSTKKYWWLPIVIKCVHIIFNIVLLGDGLYLSTLLSIGEIVFLSLWSKEIYVPKEKKSDPTSDLSVDDIVSSPADEKTSAEGADDLVKYKELFDSGVITQEEYNEKKKQILGL